VTGHHNQFGVFAIRDLDYLLCRIAELGDTLDMRDITEQISPCLLQVSFTRTNIDPSDIVFLIDSLFDMDRIKKVANRPVRVAIA
jgi:hypothetical protein